MANSIPPNTSTGGNNKRSRRNGRGIDRGPIEPKVQKRDPVKIEKMIVPFQPPRMELREVPLELFKEDRNDMMIIGEFPGLNKIDDLVIQVDENGLVVVSKPSEAESLYYGTCELPKPWMTTIDKKNLNNGVMTVILEEEAGAHRYVH